MRAASRGGGDRHAGADGASGIDEDIARLISRLTRGGRSELVWTNPLGGRTFRLRVRGEVHYLKTSPPDVPATHDVALEAERLQWIGPRLPVPEVVDAGRSGPLAWMLTRAVPGTPASDRRWLEQPRRTAAVLGDATRQFHDALAESVADCPFSWRISDRVERGGFSDAFRRKAVEAPDETDLVVSHGDLCAPNIVLRDDGSVGGFLDLGTMGVADRAVDLGSQLWSLEFNGMARFFEDFLAAYGDQGDAERIRWYRDLYATV